MSAKRCWMFLSLWPESGDKPAVAVGNSTALSVSPFRYLLNGVECRESLPQRKGFGGLFTKKHLSAR
jgi:hypothetical protein